MKSYHSHTQNVPEEVLDNDSLHCTTGVLSTPVRKVNRANPKGTCGRFSVTIMFPASVVSRVRSGLPCKVTKFSFHETDNNVIWVNTATQINDALKPAEATDNSDFKIHYGEALVRQKCERLLPMTSLVVVQASFPAIGWLSGTANMPS